MSSLGSVVITLDFDSWDHEELLMGIFKNLYQERRVIQVYERRSSSGRGAHYKVGIAVPSFILENVDPHHVEDHIKSFKWALRFMLGEDYGRLKVDSFRIKEKLKEEILFYRKDGQNVEEWKRIL